MTYYTLLHVVLIIIQMLKLMKTQTFLNKSNTFGSRKIISNEFNLIKTQKKYQSNFSNFFESIPPVTRYILYANGFIFSIGLFMSQSTYIKEFFYNKMALNYGKYHVLLTTHFAKGNVFDFFFDSAIVGLVGSNIERSYGSNLMSKLVLTSIGIGIFILINYHKEDYFIKSEAIVRSLIWFFIFKDPYGKIMLLPFPIKVPGYGLGIFFFLVDYLTRKWVNNAGLISGFILANSLI